MAIVEAGRMYKEPRVEYMVEIAKAALHFDYDQYLKETFKSLQEAKAR